MPNRNHALFGFTLYRFKSYTLLLSTAALFSQLYLSNRCQCSRVDSSKQWSFQLSQKGPPQSLSIIKCPNCNGRHSSICEGCSPHLPVDQLSLAQPMNVPQLLSIQKLRPLQPRLLQATSALMATRLYYCKPLMFWSTSPLSHNVRLKCKCYLTVELRSLISPRVPRGSWHCSQRGSSDCVLRPLSRPGRNPRYVRLLT